MGETSSMPGQVRESLRAIRALAILDEISAAVLVEDLSSVLDRILETACSCTGADEGSFFLLDYIRDELRVYKEIEGHSREYARLQVGDKENPINTALEQKSPVIQRGIHYAEGREANSLISIPILSGESCLGVLCACRQRKGRFPTAVEKTFLINLANLAALAIENHRQNEEATRNHKALSIAVDWGKNPEPLLQKVVDSALEVAGAQVVILYEYDEEAGDVRIPPKIAGDLRHKEILLDKGRISGHRNSVVFQMLDRKLPFYATNAPREWLEEGFYQSEEEVTRSFLGREGIESSAAVPLWIQDRPVGVLFINYRWPQIFTPGLRRRIELFADQAAIAIHNSRRSERYTRNLDLLQDIGNTINAFSAPDTESLCDLIHQQVGLLMEARNFILCLYDDRGKICKPCYMRDEKDKLEDFDASDWNSGRCAEVCRTGVPILRNEDRPTQIGDKLLGSPAVSWLGAPMKAGGRVIGVIALQSYTSAYVYTREHKALLSTIAAQSATAIDHFVNLIEAHHEIEELGALMESAEAVALAQLKPHIVLKTVLKQAVRALRAREGVIFRFDLAHNDFAPECSYGSYGIRWSNSRRLHWGEGLTGSAVQQRTTLIQADYFDWPGHVPELEHSGIRDKASSMIAAALVWEERVLGALTVIAGKERPFTIRDKEIMNRFARLAEVALLRRLDETQEIGGPTPEDPQ